MPVIAVAAVAAVAAAGAVVEVEAVAMFEAKTAARIARGMRRKIPPCQDRPDAVDRHREGDISPGHRQIIRCLYPYPQELHRHRSTTAAVGLYRHRSTAVAVDLYRHRSAAVAVYLYSHRSTAVAVEQAVCDVASDMWYCRGMWHRRCRSGE